MNVNKKMQVRALLVRRRQMAANTEMGMVCDTTVKHTVKRGLLLCCLFDRTDYCATWLCPPHPLLTLGKAFVTANYYVQFSKLKSNSVFTCIRWRMDSGRGEHRSSADCQWQPLLSYITALFLRWSFTRTDYCAAWLCPPHPLLTLEKAFCSCKLFCSVF